MSPNIGMKLAMVLAFGNPGASGIRCYNDEKYARTLLASQAADPFRAGLKALEDARNKALDLAGIAAREAIEAAIAAYHDLVDAGGDPDQLLDIRMKSIADANAAYALAVEAADIDYKKQIAPILTQRDAAVAARNSKLLNPATGVWVEWPDALGPFPAEATIDAWEAGYDKTAAKEAIEASSGMLNADLRALAIIALPAGHPTRVKAETINAQLAAVG